MEDEEEEGEIWKYWKTFVKINNFSIYFIGLQRSLLRTWNYCCLLLLVEAWVTYLVILYFESKKPAFFSSSISGTKKNKNHKLFRDNCFVYSATHRFFVELASRAPPFVSLQLVCKAMWKIFRKINEVIWRRQPEDWAHSSSGTALYIFYNTIMNTIMFCRVWSESETTILMI